MERETTFTYDERGNVATEEIFSSTEALTRITYRYDCWETQ